jgi:flagellar biosynthesis protein FliR
MADLTFDASTVAGLLFAIMRVTGLILGAPQLTRRIPVPGQIAFSLSVGMFLMEPVPASELDLAPLVTGMFANFAIGLILGFLATLILNMFVIAGGVLDVTSGLGVSALYDPQMGRSSTVYERFFDITAITIFFVLGGPRLLVAGLANTVEVVPLWGRPVIDSGLADVAVMAVAKFFIAGLEIAVPALAALFLAELVLGIAARMLPEANVFLLGLPIKLLISMAAAAVVMLSFPTYVRSAMSEMTDVIGAVSRSFG